MTNLLMRTTKEAVHNVLLPWLQHEMYNNPAVVFDIDDTLLAYKQNTNNNKRSWVRIEAMFELYTFLRQNGFYIFLITARPYSKKNLQTTTQQLKSFGFTQYNGLFLMPDIDPSTRTSYRIAKFKTSIRTSLSKAYLIRIILNIGNLWTDLLHPDELSISINQPKYINILFKKGQMWCLKMPDSHSG